MIYVCRKAGDDSAIKVGTSTNVMERLRMLSVQYQSDIELICTFEGGQPEEKALHSLMTSCRIEGEWFRRNAILDQLILEHRTGQPVLVKRTTLKVSPCSDETRIARELMRRLMRTFSVDHKKMDLMNECYNRLKAINEKWTHRRVRAIYFNEANRISLQETLDLAAAAGMSHEELVSVLTVEDWNAETGLAA